MACLYYSHANAMDITYPSARKGNRDLWELLSTNGNPEMYFRGLLKCQTRLSERFRELWIW